MRIVFRFLREAADAARGWWKGVSHVIVFVDDGTLKAGPTYWRAKMLRRSRPALRDGNFGRRIIVLARPGQTEEFVWDYVRKGWVSFAAPWEPVL